MLSGSFLINAAYLPYEGELISSQPNFLPVEINLFFFDAIAL